MLYREGQSYNDYNDFTTDLVACAMCLGVYNLRVEDESRIALFGYIDPILLSMILDSLDDVPTDVPFDYNTPLTFSAIQDGIGMWVTNDATSLDIHIVLQELKTLYRNYPDDQEPNLVVLSADVVHPDYDPYTSYDYNYFQLSGLFDDDVNVKLNEVFFYRNSKFAVIGLDTENEGYVVASAGSVDDELILPDDNFMAILFLFEYDTNKRPVLIVGPNHHGTDAFRELISACITNAVSVIEITGDEQLDALIEVGAISNPGVRMEIAQEYYNSL